MTFQSDLKKNILDTKEKYGRCTINVLVNVKITLKCNDVKPAELVQAENSKQHRFWSAMIFNQNRFQRSKPVLGSKPRK